jgi:hypothetical protein
VLRVGAVFVLADGAAKHARRDRRLLVKIGSYRFTYDPYVYKARAETRH